MRGRKQSPEHILNLANARRGFKQSNKQKERTREKNSKSWMITAPNGQVTIIKSLFGFCMKQSNGNIKLFHDVWYCVRRGKDFKGFTFKKLG